MLLNTAIAPCILKHINQPPEKSSIEHATFNIINPFSKTSEMTTEKEKRKINRHKINETETINWEEKTDHDWRNHQSTQPNPKN